MALAKRPIRSPRAKYKIELIKVHLDDDSDAIDLAPTDTVNGTKRDIVVLMKEAIGDFLGLTAMAWNDPLNFGIFRTNPNQAGATNAGAAFTRRVGGFKQGSYTFEAKERYTISEIVKNDNGFTRSNANFRTFTIGFPRGHSLNEIARWFATTQGFNQTRAIITPNGARFPLSPVD